MLVSQWILIFNPFSWVEQEFSKRPICARSCPWAFRESGKRILSILFPHLYIKLYIIILPTIHYRVHQTYIQIRWMRIRDWDLGFGQFWECKDVWGFIFSLKDFTDKDVLIEKSQYSYFYDNSMLQCMDNSAKRTPHPAWGIRKPAWRTVLFGPSLGKVEKEQEKI